MIGCGYEPAIPGATPWKPPAPPLVKLGYRHPLPTVCAGYTTRLPEVLEVARQHVHWKNHTLTEFCGGKPTDLTLALLEVLDVELGALRHCVMTAKADGGLR